MLLLTHLIFDGAFAALATLNALLLLTVFSSSIKLWPTPSTRSWQHYTFWPLFRGGLSLTLLYAILTAHWPQDGEVLRFAIGLLCVVVGFGVTIYGYFHLGIENTYGAEEGLVTKGLYRYSRNPQYVASILGFSAPRSRTARCTRRSCAGLRSSFTSSCLTPRNPGCSGLMAMPISPTRSGRRAFFEPRSNAQSFKLSRPRRHPGNKFLWI